MVKSIKIFLLIAVLSCLGFSRANAQYYYGTTFAKFKLANTTGGFFNYSTEAMHFVLSPSLKRIQFYMKPQMVSSLATDAVEKHQQEGLFYNLTKEQGNTFIFNGTIPSSFDLAKDGVTKAIVYGTLQTQAKSIYIPIETIFTVKNGVVNVAMDTKIDIKKFGLQVAESYAKIIGNSMEIGIPAFDLKLSNGFVQGIKANQNGK